MSGIEKTKSQTQTYNHPILVWKLLTTTNDKKITMINDVCEVWYCVSPSGVNNIRMINFFLNCWRSCSKYTLNRLQSPKKTRLIRLSKVRTIICQCHISVTPGRNTIHVVIAFAESSELIAKDTLQIITTVFVLSKYHQNSCTTNYHHSICIINCTSSTTFTLPHWPLNNSTPHLAFKSPIFGQGFSQLVLWDKEIIGF